MDMNKNLKKLLYRSFDGPLSDKERRRLKEALARSPELREEHDRIKLQRKLLKQAEKPEFAPGFADRVLRRLEASGAEGNGWEHFYSALLAMFRRLALAGGVALLLLLIYNLQLGDKISSEEAFFASDTTYEELRRLPLF
jgi:anti-sigma factor RsiW